LLKLLTETVIIALANAPIRSFAADRHRWRLLRLAGVRVEKSLIRRPVNLAQFGNLDRIKIARGTRINVNLRIGAGDNAVVEIGEDCAIGPNVSFETMGHDVRWTPENHWGGKAQSIIVGNRCWIGAGSMILGGVTIGDGAVVAAGSVVTRDVAPSTLVAGVPAVVKRTIE
jgi:maltose O-acetyltransferase